jgi:diaminopimelate decarboxylase
MLYDARYEALIANRAGEPVDTTVTVVGKHCESGDVLIRDALLARPEIGDVLVIAATGAYCYAMASNYNGNPRPAVVMVKDGRGRLVVQRETYADLVAKQLPLGG